jgi:hypothetical protein
MIKKCYLFLFIISISFLSLVPSQTHAQQEIKFLTMDVKLWPEFDQPTMLVIYDITLSPNISLPTEIKLRIPGTSGGPNAVAAAQPDGNLFDIPYTQKNVADGWIEVMFKATTPDLRIEYYDPKLKMDGPARHYEYQWSGDYAVEAFRIQVQQPIGADQMRISPSLGKGTSYSDGLVYFNANWGALPAGQITNITVDYQKQDDRLSSEIVPIEPSGPLNDTTTGRFSIMPALPYFLGGLGLLLIIGGVIWYVQSGRQKAEPVFRRSRRIPAADTELEPDETGNIYCHQCGKRASPGDRFCRACGAQLRVP